MGYTAHHAIIVTAWQQSSIEAAHDKAREIFEARIDANVTGLDWKIGEVLASPVNEYYTFIIPPDGSKEGWPESNAGDNRRLLFIEWMNTSPHYLDWVEVRYGGDSRGANVAAHSDEEN